MNERAKSSQMSSRPLGRPETWAIVLAAGSGQRMAARTNKVFLPIGGRPILARTLDGLSRSDEIDGIVLVTTEADREACEALIRDGAYRKVKRITTGGPTRHASEWHGLQTIEREIDAGSVEVVLVHDAVRPFVSVGELADLVEAARAAGAAIPAVPGDRIVLVDEDGFVRSGGDDLWIAQTPQAFRAKLLLEAHRKAAAEGFVGADTSAVVERLGHPVTIVPGRAENIKITTSDDLMRAEIIAEELGRITELGISGALEASS
jgi:2-C-methyl-D-erythritol 4-phosphate cytidylyltransferase